MLTLIVALLTLQQAPASTPPAPAPAPAAQARRAATPASNTVEVRVTDRLGKTIGGARVTAEGPSSRDGLSDVSGLVTFRTVTLGTYRVHVEAEGFIALEKETVVRAGAAAPVEFALSVAPKPPVPEPAPAPAPVAPPPLPPGEARVLSLLDVAERSLSGKEPVRTVPIGCSGQSRAQLLVIRESLQTPAQADADDMLYVVAGEATLTLAGKSQPIESGWFSVVPRGSARTITRRGKNPVILLSIVGGPPCTTASTGQ